VTNVITVDPAFLAAVIITVSPVYTDKSSFNWNIVVAAAPGVNAYQPVAVDSVV
jgi:hypothetical protein